MQSLRCTRALALSGLLCFGAPAWSAEDALSSIRAAVEVACERADANLSEMAAAMPDATGIKEEALAARGTTIGWKRRFALPEGDQLRIERVAPGAQLRRLAVEYWSRDGDGPVRPRVAAVADSACRIRLGRRLLYEPDFPEPVAIAHLDKALEATGEREPLNPPVPSGNDPEGVPVALVDSGVNYLLADIHERLARDSQGRILGHDYWDGDARPFDAHPVRSVFFPGRHGTRTATLLLREAPDIRLVPYRYPRPDMSRMRALIADAAEHGVQIVNLSMGSNEAGEWAAFEAAARAHPEILFVLSAGNSGRNIDRRPVYPAALPLDNAITVTSVEDDGALARGSNWGRESVDLAVPAERMAVTGFDGNARTVSGSSYAAVRVTALAARLAAEHPRWEATRLKEAILARALPIDTNGGGRIAGGFMPRPHEAEQLPVMSTEGAFENVARYSLTADPLAGRKQDGSSSRWVFRPTFAYFERSAWTRERLHRHAQDLVAILGQCGIRIPEIDVHVLQVPTAYRYFHEATARRLVREFALPKPTVYFVRDTLQVDAYDAEAIGKSNSRTRPELRYTVWFTEETRDPGIALAHELTHVLMDSGRHVETQGNLMRARTGPDATHLTAQQCKALTTHGTENGLLTRTPESP